ncbi:MAG: class I SAM-dependent methyltransferase [Bacteroidetes bacterium]|nr:class I SAM-dependent methyltransferase [Bacteroidota bacterium]
MIFLLKYFKYWFFAKNAHGIHSPFVFQLYNEAINKKGSYYSFDKIEHLRKKLLISKKEIEVADFGTGKSGKRSIAAIVQRSAKNEKYCQLLFRLAYHFHPETILELGTSLGISTLYLASANKKTTVITIEGSPEVAECAQKNFRTENAGNIKLVTGNFDVVLPDVLNQKIKLAKRKLDFCFFDGNHHKQPTLKYFSQCLEYAHNDSVFIFDDIHWSNEMEEAWEEIKSHPKVSVTVDLFFLGLVFFRTEQVKENFTLRF